MAIVQNYDAEHPVVDAIRAGDRYAFEELVRRHGKWVRGVVFGVLGDADRVDDVTQQVWTSVWERIGELRETGRWRSWLYRMAHNAAIDAGRTATRLRKHQKLALAEPPRRSETSEPAHEAIRSEERQAVMSAIQSLPAMYREPFVLRHLNGWSYRQIAEVMEMPVDSIETRLVRARRYLKEALKNKVA